MDVKGFQDGDIFAQIQAVLFPSLTPQASTVANGWASVHDTKELLQKSINYKFIKIRGAKIEYEPSIAPNENYPLRNGTYGLHFTKGAFFAGDNPTDQVNSQTPVNGIWSPWKPFKLYFNASKHLAKHRWDPMMTFDNSGIILDFGNTDAYLAVLFSTSRVFIGTTAQAAAGEIIGRLKVSWYCQLLVSV